ncbi:hypothetical protein VNO77_39262 [Canavalia gladiata]|uniref:Uncharacterized protein n=1 Tax=Canavalia gladiata TaxID=3824 RepID=A0AAN9KBW5_CANGL
MEVFKDWVQLLSQFVSYAVYMICFVSLFRRAWKAVIGCGSMEGHAYNCTSNERIGGFGHWEVCTLSFAVLYLLPPQQLESALNKHANLRAPLLLMPANQLSTLVVLGLANATHVQQHLSTSLHPSDTSFSVHGATLT